jgi:predicted phosphodiesterase
MSDHEGQKFCPSCKTWKDIECFSLEGQGRGRRRTCAQCVYKKRKQNKEEKIGRKTSLATALVELSRHDIERLESIGENEFIKKTNAKEAIQEFGFESIQKEALGFLYNSGHHRPKSISLKPGRYMVVGDSHGKHTRTRMFDLIKMANEYLAIDNIIHIGHILDDDNDISYHWADIDNLIVISKIEEANILEKVIKSEKYNFEIVRNEIEVGNYRILNQDLIQDYVKTFVGSLDQEIFPESVIVNGHRHEMDTRTTYKGTTFAMCPGSLCEKHIVKTIKQIDFTSGYQIKEARPDGFIKYRRMKHMYEFWQQGMIILELNEEGEVYTYPARIKKIDDEYVTSYFDEIITSDNVYQPDSKIMVSSDHHVPSHDPKVFDIQDQFVKDYEPDIFVNGGDFVNGSALNHHAMDRNHPILDMTLLEEFSQANYILGKMAEWAPKKYMIHGNHERFLEDFTAKYPQLTDILNFKLLAGLEDHGYEVIDLLGVLELGDLKIIHGDMRMYGQKGNKFEKVSRTFGSNTIMGHVHKPSMRFNCYAQGFCGQMDQNYNEVNASNWVHGFSICNQFRGHSFITPMNILDHKMFLNGKTYTSDNDDFWKDYNSYKVKISYSFK